MKLFVFKRNSKDGSNARMVGLFDTQEQAMDYITETYGNAYDHEWYHHTKQLDYGEFYVTVETLE